MGCNVGGADIQRLSQTPVEATRLRIRSQCVANLLPGSFTFPHAKLYCFDDKGTTTLCNYAAATPL